MNILITEGHTDANIGSGALVENSLVLLRDRYPGANLRVVSIYPEAFRKTFDVDSVFDPFEYPYKKPWLQKLAWIFKTVFWMAVIRLQAASGMASVRFYKSKLDNYLWADMVVSVHAERIKEAFYIDALYTLFSFRIAHLIGKKVVLFPCTLGPYGFGTRWLVNRWLRNVDLLFTRDELSFKLANETKGLSSDRIVRSADVAVMQRMVGRTESLALIGCSSQDQLVGISVMHWRYIKGNRSPYSNYAAYVAEMAKVVDRLITGYGVKVVLYPTNYAIRGCTTEDREACREIYQSSAHKDRVICVEKFMSPAELKGALACSEVNITTRMHACIFSTGAGVPTLAVNYLYKLREYMANLGLEDFSIDIEEFNADWMLSAFDRMWQRRAEIRLQIQTRMEANRSLLQTSMRHLEMLDFSTN